MIHDTLRDVKNTYKHDPQLISLCFEINAFYRHRWARKHMTLIAPMVGDCLFVVRNELGKRYRNTVMYRVTEVLDKHPDTGACRVIAHPIPSDDKSIRSMSPLTGTFTPQGYHWSMGYTDLREHVVNTLSKWGGRRHLKNDFADITHNYPFIAQYLDKKLINH